MLPDIVLCEAEWVLASVYNLPRARIAEVLRRLLDGTEFAFADRTTVSAAVDSYAHGKAEFSENLLKRQGANYTEVAEALMDIGRFPSHGQMIDWRTAEDIGITHVHALPRQSRLWQRYWRLYCYLLPVCGMEGRVFESLDRTIIVS